MALKIVKNGDTWQLPANFQLISSGFEKRMEIIAKAFGDGGADRGDNMVGVRQLSLEGQLSANADMQYDNKWDELVLKLTQKDFYLEDGDWRILIGGTRMINHSFLPGLRKRLSQIEIDLLALDPFWYYKSLSSKGEDCPTPPKQFVVLNGGNYSVYPVIKVTANANNSDMSIKNITDGDVLFSYQDTGFTTGKELLVDCKDGTVKLEAANTIRYFNGQFLRLLPGNNTIEYNGADAHVSFEWYKRKL